jgi:predicted histone-like DNA-binding protein
MSKIIYRKVRTAPGLKLTDANWNANAAYYAKAVSLETLSQRDMARHISSHGSPYTVDVVMGVLEAYRNCLIEQLLESKKVKVDGLGTFYVTIANKEGGEKDITKFNISNIAQGLRLRFLPDASQEEDLSSKEFLKKAKFVDVATLTKDKTVEDEEESDTDQGGGTVVDNEENQGGGSNENQNENENPGGGDNGGGTNNNGGGDDTGGDADN